MTTKEAYQFLQDRAKTIKGVTYYVALDDSDKQSIFSALIQVFEMANYGAYFEFVKTMDEIKNAH